MAEVFLSYKSERRRAAEHLAYVLEGYGYVVWFDYQLVKGHDFGQQIDRQVRGAKALVALWCSKAVESRWVAEEVDLAHSLGILVPVKIEQCELPVGFRRHDYIDLSDWDGAPRSYRLDPLLDAIEQRVDRAPAPNLKMLRQYEAVWRRFGAPPLSAFALGPPLSVPEQDRSLFTQTIAAQAGAQAEHADKLSLTALAAKEWPFVRDSGDLRRLKRFEEHFRGTYYADEARALHDTIEAAKTSSTKEPGPPNDQSRLKVETAQSIRWMQPGSGRSAAEVFRDAIDAPEMVIVPTGSFMMGSPADEKLREDWQKEIESPRQRVVISRPLAVARYAVTVAEYRAYVDSLRDETGSGEPPASQTGRSWRNPGFDQDDGSPVVCISWRDAKLYTKWLSANTGRSYRLLSEAEWEYCCRAGTVSAFWWGDTILPGQANFHYSTGPQVSAEWKRTTSPVDSFMPNQWGLYNVHGNVWEWVLDCWHESYNGHPGDQSAWVEDKVGTPRVVRGGSWSDQPADVRSASRNGVRETVRSYCVGFRVARELE